MSKALSFLAFNDPLFSKQWHLNNTGQLQGAEIGEDINVTFVWPDYTGRGIVVGIVDDGFDVTHPDLVSNYNFDLSWDFVEGKIGGITTSSDDDHGTSVAGLIASTANNEIGGVGVAWNASLIGYRFLEETSNSTIATRFVEVGERALSAKIDILNNSWGPMLDPFDNQDYQQTYWNVARDLVSSGRDGLGTIILFAAGNNRKDQMNTNYDPTDNLPYAIIVAASEPNGAVTDFSTPGSSILITAPGSYTYTTDLQSTWGTNKLPGVAGNYADSPETRFSGTSAATPIAAGVVALMLEANPGLGYRDVQEILVHSARSGLFLNDAGAQINGAKHWNGGGLVTSHDFGLAISMPVKPFA